MSARGGTQLTISKFFVSKNKSNGVRTDDECPPRKKSKISEVIKFMKCVKIFKIKPFFFKFLKNFSLLQKDLSTYILMLLAA